MKCIGTASAIVDAVDQTHFDGIDDGTVNMIQHAMNNLERLPLVLAISVVGSACNPGPLERRQMPFHCGRKPREPVCLPLSCNHGLDLCSRVKVLSGLFD